MIISFEVRQLSQDTSQLMHTSIDLVVAIPVKRNTWQMYTPQLC